MRFIFFIALIFIIVEIGISSYLVYDLHCKNDEEIKNLEKQDVKTIVTLRKVVVLDNFISLLLSRSGGDKCRMESIKKECPGLGF